MLRWLDHLNGSQHLALFITGLMTSVVCMTAFVLAIW